jgi:hypothetical protein
MCSNPSTSKKKKFKNQLLRRIKVLSHAGQILFETLSQNNPLQKRVGGVAQGIGPEFKP